MNEVDKIERQYLNLIQNTEKENIDFFGINMVDAEENDFIYKIYQAQKTSKNRNHPLVDFVFQKGMLRYFADVQDSENPERTRIDISLYQRTDKNVQELFHYLQEIVPFFEKNKKQVELVSKMKITDVPDYQFASLYHVGLIEDKKIPEILKFHFFTRWCENPNHHTKEGYRDEVYLDYFRSIGIEVYEELAQKANYLLQKCGGHLWMAGMDLSSDKIKYKIYLKNVKDAYQYLTGILGESGKKRLMEINQWNEKHKECRLAGVAVAKDSDKVSSLNLYYHVD